jgi:hypothetical protein
MKEGRQKKEGRKMKEGRCERRKEGRKMREGRKDNEEVVFVRPRNACHTSKKYMYIYVCI